MKNTHKFDYMPGGKICGVMLIVVTIVLVLVSVWILIKASVDFFSVLSLLLMNGGLIYYTYKFYKPGFTEVIFSEDAIVGKTHFEQEKLPIHAIKGIWYLKNSTKEEEKVKPYSEKDNLKNCIIVIGDINCFTDVGYVGINGAFTLHDTFKMGYVALMYRKKLKEVLRDYHAKIQNNAVHKTVNEGIEF